MTQAEAFNRIQELNRISEKALSAYSTIQELINQAAFTNHDYAKYADDTCKELLLIVKEKQTKAQQLTMKHYGSNS